MSDLIKIISESCPSDVKEIKKLCMFDELQEGKTYHLKMTFSKKNTTLEIWNREVIEKLTNKGGE